MGQARVQTLVIPSRLSEVQPAVEAIMDAVARHAFPDTARFAIRLALDEAITNAVRHGNRSDPTKSVTIKFSVTSRQARISVRDQGQGFHPEEVPDPTAEENLCRPGGRGVMLMRAYMSRVTFNKKGTCVTLVKRRETSR